MIVTEIMVELSWFEQLDRLDLKFDTWDKWVNRAYHGGLINSVEAKSGSTQLYFICVYLYMYLKGLFVCMGIVYIENHGQTGFDMRLLVMSEGYKVEM